MGHIIEEIKELRELGLGSMQTKFYDDMLEVAKEVEVVPISKVFSAAEVRQIIEVIRPQKRQCYRNAALLSEMFPNKVRYVEGFTRQYFNIEHAFNKVGDKYVDITFELALGEDVTKYEYVSLVEASSEEVLEDIRENDNITGDYYRRQYIKKLQANN